MANQWDSLLGSYAGMGQGQSLAMQQQYFNTTCVTGTTATATSAIMMAPYVYAAPQPKAKEPHEETPLEWLDRRVDEMRVRL